ncbi:hypothetical protein A6V29_15510 [Blastococcus sp. CCUG 61487]|nr:hypothetical protein A6V29_15510 [Blastococcus sp. CCUG 61487]
MVRVDGRTARRERNRAAVIDALLGLIDESHVAPSTDEIAERAGVSVSSLFRYFESLDDLQEQTIERHFERFAPLFEIPTIGAGPLADRIDRLVDARTTLYRSIAPVARLARSRALDNPRLAGTLVEVRARFTRQLRDHFAPELAALPRASGNDLVALVDTLTSFESWDLVRTTHGYSERLVRRAWHAGVSGLIDSFAPNRP